MSGKKNALSARLKYALNEANITQAQAANLLNISLSGLKNWLSGIHEPNVSQLLQFAEVTRTDAVWLMTGEGPMHPGDAAPPAVPEAHVIDPVLLGRCLDAIHKLFQELNMKAPSTALGEEAALIYRDVAASGLQSLEEQLGAIRVLITQRRRALLTAPPGKHEGSA